MIWDLSIRKKKQPENKKLERKEIISFHVEENISRQNKYDEKRTK